MNIVDKELTTLAFCWRIERRDGVALGFTSHDRDIARDGLLFRAAPGMLPSAIGLSTGFEADRIDVEGALTSDAVRAEDLACGRWDGAAIEILLIDWEDVNAAPMRLVQGELGDVARRRGGFVAELRGLAARLERAVVEQTSPECRAQLGDWRCRVDMAGRVRVTRVLAVQESGRIEVASAATGNAYAYGRIRWLSGRNSGLSCGIFASAGTVLALREPPCFAAAPGDLVEIAEGCDRSLTTCASRFGNAANFRGEPHLPGTDLLTRYASG